jgi:transcriptional regulator with XRE-family HTH domain
MTREQPGEPEGGSGEPGSARAGATVPRLLLGHQLRRLREAAAMTPEQAGYQIRASRSKISRIENGRVGMKDRDVADLLTLYGVTDQQTRAATLELARRASAPGWWAEYSDILPSWFAGYLGLEAAASVIRTFEIQFVHGLFQTADYARAVTLLGNTAATRAEVDRRVGLRLQRQELLRAADPPRVWSVMDEAALRRPVGGRKVMQAQLRQLAETAAALPSVTLQAVPFRRGGHAAAGGSFTLLRFGEPDLPDMVYIEQLTTALYLEGPEHVDHYLEVMNRVSAEALTPAGTVRFIRKIMSED